MNTLLYLAAVTVSPGNGITDSDLGRWLLILTFFLGLALLTIQIITALKRKPPIEAEFATKAELASIKRENDRYHEKLDQSIDAIRKEIQETFKTWNSTDEARSSAIHKRVDDVLRAVSRLEGKVERESRS